jgi:hypothetical protein
MPAPVVKMNPTGGPVSVQIVIGFAQWGRYRFVVYDPDGRNPHEVFNGRSDDNIADYFILTQDPASVVNHFLHWDVIVAPFTERPDQSFSVAVVFTQSGISLPGSPIVEIGQFSRPALVAGQAQLALG